MKSRLALLAVLLAGCTAIGHERVAGWPRLEIVEHHVPHAEMRDRCARYTGFGMSPEACAEFDLVNRKCHIWYSADFPPQPFIVEHERLHCAGYDHAGSKAMANWLRVHQASEGAPGAAAGASR
jgi:hypothetical protein